MQYCHTSAEQVHPSYIYKNFLKASLPIPSLSLPTLPTYPSSIRGWVPTSSVNPLRSLVEVTQLLCPVSVLQDEVSGECQIWCAELCSFFTEWELFAGWKVTHSSWYIFLSSILPLGYRDFIGSIFVTRQEVDLISAMFKLWVVWTKKYFIGLN